MPALLSFLGPSIKSGKLRSKAIYALSGLLKHNAPAVKQFEEAGGWKILKAALEGMPRGTRASSRIRPIAPLDPDITVRRKTAFLLNSLIVPAQPVPQARPTPPPSLSASTGPSSTSTSVTLHPSAQTSAPSEPVHPNSHAAMLANPSSFSTSPATLKALEEHGLLQALVSAVTSPTPHGVDGEHEGDADFDEKVMRCVCCYQLMCVLFLLILTHRHPQVIAHVHYDLRRQVLRRPKTRAARVHRGRDREGRHRARGGGAMGPDDRRAAINEEGCRVVVLHLSIVLSWHNRS